MKKVAICGGHLTPALALIEELEKEKDVEVIFFGRKYSAEGTKIPSAEFKLITEKNIKFIPINAGRLQRKFTRYSALALAKTPTGLAQSIVALAREKPNVVVSFGGYVSLPVAFSAWLLRIKSISHEQSVIPGLATKINAKFSSRIFLSWQKTADYFKNKKTTVIGNLTRRDVFSKKAASGDIQQFIAGAGNLIFATGGNQGSHFINSLISKSQNKLKDYRILHQVGILNYKGDLDIAKEKSNSAYLPLAYLSNSDFGAAINSAKIVIARSGANTVWELATLAKVAVLIPLPISASGEQLANARVLEEAGSAVILNQSETTPETLQSKIKSIEKNYSKYQKSAEILSTKMPKDAAEKLAKAVLGYT